MRAPCGEEASPGTASWAQGGSEPSRGPEQCQVTGARLAYSPALGHSILCHLHLLRQFSNPSKERAGPGPSAGINSLGWAATANSHFSGLALKSQGLLSQLALRLLYASEELAFFGPLMRHTQED